MSYVLEWQVGEDRDPRYLVRQVRVFRDAGGLKAFVRSRAFQRLAGSELLITLRARGGAGGEVITTAPAIAGWDPQIRPLPPPLLRSAWAERLSAMALRARLVERLAADLKAAQDLALLTADQVADLLGQLARMLEDSAR